MKKLYQNPEMLLLVLATEDIIQTSGDGNELSYDNGGKAADRYDIGLFDL